MDVFEDTGHKLSRHTALGALGTALGENLAVAIGLQDGHVVFLLVLTNLTADAHALRQQVHELVVEFVDLVAQLLDALGGNAFVADDEQRENIVEHVGRDLLTGIAPRIVGGAVGLHEESVEAQVHGLLC